MVIQYKTRLTLAVNVLLEGSKQVTKEELQMWYEDENVMQRWRKNPMGSFMRLLAEALETESKSAENRRKEKERANKRPNISQSRAVHYMSPTSLRPHHCRLQILSNPWPRRYLQCLTLQQKLLFLNINEMCRMRLQPPTAPPPPTVHLRALTDLNLTSKNFRIRLSAS